MIIAIGQCRRCRRAQERLQSLKIILHDPKLLWIAFGCHSPNCASSLRGWQGHGAPGAPLVLISEADASRHGIPAELAADPVEGEFRLGALGGGHVQRLGFLLGARLDQARDADADEAEGGAVARARAGAGRPRYMRGASNVGSGANVAGEELKSAVLSFSVTVAPATPSPWRGATPFRRAATGCARVRGRRADRR